jgi:hypothetical protein
MKNEKTRINTNPEIIFAYNSNRDLNGLYLY